MPRKPPIRGDLIKVTWVDIFEDVTGNPENARPAERVSYALFWARELRGPIECLVTTTTIDTDNPSQVGYCIYPWGAILDITVIKRNLNHAVQHGRKT